LKGTELVSIKHYNSLLERNSFRILENKLILFYSTARWYRERASQRVRHYGLEFLAGSRPREALQHCIIAKSFRWCCTSSIPIISHLPTSYIRPRSKCSFRFAQDLHSRVAVTQFACIALLIALIAGANNSFILFFRRDSRVRSLPIS